MFPKCKLVVRYWVIAVLSVFTFYVYLVVFPALNQYYVDLSSVIKVKQAHHYQIDSLQTMASLKAKSPILQELIPRENAVIEDDASYTSIEDNLTGTTNPHPFNYIINEKNICHNKHIFVIVYIHTAPIHYKQRMVIRQTWGNPKHYNENIRVIFMLGKTSDPFKVQNSLFSESEQYGDIVQEDFLDTYTNLTYKGVAGLKWISKYCRHAKFVLKTDDDVFVNMFTLLRYFKSRDKPGMNRGLLMCSVWYHTKVKRKGKWKVPKNQFKDKYYPAYCAGSAFSMSMDVALSLYKASYHVPFMWVDDFYITGLLPLKVGIKLTQFKHTYVEHGHKLKEKFTGPQWYNYVFCHVHNLNRMQLVWSRLLELESEAALLNFKYALPPLRKTVNSKSKRVRRRPKSSPKYLSN